MSRILQTIACAGFMSFCLTGAAIAQTHSIDWQARDAGGAGGATGPGRVLYTSCGQPAIGTASSAAHVLNSGYLFVRVLTSGAPRLVTQTDIDFGTTPPGTPVTRDLLISNAGNALLTISNQSVGGSGFMLATPAGSSVNPSGSTVARLSFDPPSVGNWNGTYVVSSNDPNNPVVTVQLRGIGGNVGGPRISLGTTVLDFGYVAVNDLKDLPLTIRNIGSADLAITQQTIGGNDALDFRLSSPALTPIRPGDSTIATIGAVPRSGGAKNATFTIRSNSTVTPEIEVQLVSIATGVEFPPVTPGTIRLHQNYPNPFSAGGGSAFGGSSTNIQYDLDAAGDVELIVYSLYGKQVDKLVSGWQERGTYKVRFEADNLPSGLYMALLRYRSDKDVTTQRILMTLLR